MAGHDAGNLPVLGMVPGGPTGPCEPVQGRKGALASSTHVWPVYGHSSGNRSGGLGFLGRSHAKPRRHPSPPPKAPPSNPAGIPRGSLKKRNFKKRKRRFGEAFLRLRFLKLRFFRNSACTRTEKKRD